MSIGNLNTDFEKAEYLQNLLIACATNGVAIADDYILLRRYFISKPSVASLLPQFIRANRDLPQFWNFIKHQFAHYQERREFIWGEFAGLLESLEETGESPCARSISEVLTNFNLENVHAAWGKANERKAKDPEGAVTAARTLLESVCKHLLDEMKVEYDTHADLPGLYSLVAKNLNLSPAQHTEKVFKQILGGCFSVVDGLASLRNKLGDAHGQGKAHVRPVPRHAGLAVNLAGAISVYLIETWESKFKK